MSDNGRTYMNLGKTFDVEHETICNNQRFVAQKRLLLQFERLNTEMQVKVHTNTIKGHWGRMKPKIRVKRGLGENLGSWCDFYSFKVAFADF